MNITPLEIRQKEFDQKFRGFDKEEVKAYLLSLSKEWERLQDEVKELRIKLEASDREVQKLREVESSLYKTLKTAEDTGNNMIEQATRSAELHLKETQMKADSLMNDAREKARNVIERAESKARDIVEAMYQEVRQQEEQYRRYEELKDTLAEDLRALASNTLDRVSKFEAAGRRDEVNDELKRAKETYRSYKEIAEQPPVRVESAPAAQEAPKAKQKPKPAPEPERREQEGDGSFFDQI